MTSDFDQILLVPKEISQIESRSHVSLNSDWGGIYPIISSPMKGISGPKLVKAMSKNNCLGILHRFATLEERFQNIEEVSSDSRFGVAIGVNNFEEEMKIARYAFRMGAEIICLDLANGYLPQIESRGKMLRGFFSNYVGLMTGNVVSRIGAEYIKNSGFNFVRVGIGGGNVCTTRIVTGVGRNSLTALSDCSSVNIDLVMDGGIRNSGDAVKAFVFGADYIMLGSILAYAEEAESEEGKLYGMASFTNHQLNNKEVKSIEGRDDQVDISKKRPLKEILDEFMWGIKSACTYLNCKSYTELHGNVDYVLTNKEL